MMLAALLGVVLGCGSSRTVTRIDPETTTDLSGYWNDTDSRLVAQEMIQDVLSRPWLGRFQGQKGRLPVVIVGTIKNRTSEHIEVTTFIKDLERELINSGQVQFVASKEEREEVREERADQQDFASEETMKRFQEELGADFLLRGDISSIIDQEGGTQVKYYQVNLELIDIETNRKVWIGEKKIKKVVERKGLTL
ncbi:MAG: penicillin-binding protein activator LpoB [Calditrichaeota bacterium]|nr:MAG: penicillin-binding protein activator LpoB [Calditrichota bacterium]